ncbi:MAG: NfeD family protein [Deltaproteobacteria bacterium]|nr:NfeD family protein [Deltaproteobacteria bacterium]
MEWIETLTGLQKALLIVGIVGSLAFLIQFVLMLLGGDSDSGADTDVGGHIGGGGDSADAGVGDTPEGTHVDSVHADSDVGFKLLSLQSLSVFLMMFGLVGLAVSRGGTYGDTVSLVAGFIVGLLFMFLVAKMFAFFKSLQNSGTMDLSNAVGQEGRIYLTIKPSEPGQVEVVVQDHLKIFTARSSDDSEIPTNTRVKIIRVMNNIMIVERVTPKGKE